jgi:hypothetical protein
MKFRKEKLNEMEDTPEEHTKKAPSGDKEMENLKQW